MAGQGTDAYDRSFSIGAWNIDGLYNKLTHCGFVDYLSSQDMFGFLETWLQAIPGNLATIFPNRIYIFVPAKKLATFVRTMGGIVFFENRQYEQYISKIEVNSDSGIFLKLKKELLSSDKDLVLMCLYLTPQGSHFYDEAQINGMDLLEDMYVGPSTQLSDHYFLLNCCIGNLPDFQILQNNVPILEEFENVFDTFNVPRVSFDKHVTSLGRWLLGFCQLYTI